MSFIGIKGMNSRYEAEIQIASYLESGKQLFFRDGRFRKDFANKATTKTVLEKSLPSCHTSWSKKKK
jgi:hypothetical protein